MKTKILMIYPRTELDKVGNSVGLPLSLMHIISPCDKELFEFSVIDQRVESEWEEKLANLLKDNNFSCAAISVMTGSQIKWGVKSAKIIRELSPKTKIIFGGVHPTLYPEQTAKHPLVDFVVMGDGEETFQNLIKAISGGEDIGEMNGVCYSKDGVIVNNGAASMVDLNLFPEPDYSLINPKKYFLNLYNTKNALSLVTGRGCPHRCAFCYNPVFNKRKWRSLSVDKIISRIKNLVKIGAESIDIVDDNFFTNPERVKEFCKRIKEEKLNLRFVVNCRVDYIVRFDDDFIKMLYETGFREFFVGIESGSQKVLDYIQKDITVEQVHICNKKLRNSGITPIYSFIAGFPNETVDDIQKTIKMMMKLIKENPDISLTSLKVYTPFPGSLLFEECLRQGLKAPDSFEGWSSFTYNSPSYKWRSKKLNKLLKKLSYITYFLDQKTMVKHVGGNSIILRALIKIYSKIVWYRCKFGFYYFIPEVYVMEKLRKMIS